MHETLTGKAAQRPTPLTTHRNTDPPLPSVSVEGTALFVCRNLDTKTEKGIKVTVEMPCETQLTNAIAEQVEAAVHYALTRSIKHGLFVFQQFAIAFESLPWPWSSNFSIASAYFPERFFQLETKYRFSIFHTMLSKPDSSEDEQNALDTIDDVTRKMLADGGVKEMLEQEPVSSKWISAEELTRPNSITVEEYSLESVARGALTVVEHPESELNPSIAERTVISPDCNTDTTTKNPTDFMMEDEEEFVQCTPSDRRNDSQSEMQAKQQSQGIQLLTQSNLRNNDELPFSENQEDWVSSSVKGGDEEDDENLEEEDGTPIPSPSDQDSKERLSASSSPQQPQVSEDLVADSLAGDNEVMESLRSESVASSSETVTEPYPSRQADILLPDAADAAEPATAATASSLSSCDWQQIYSPHGSQQRQQPEKDESDQEMCVSRATTAVITVPIFPDGRFDETRLTQEQVEKVKAALTSCTRTGKYPKRITFKRERVASGGSIGATVKKGLGKGGIVKKSVENDSGKGLLAGLLKTIWSGFGRVPSEKRADMEK